MIVIGGVIDVGVVAAFVGVVAVLDVNVVVEEAALRLVTSDIRNNCFYQYNFK